MSEFAVKINLVVCGQCHNPGCPTDWDLKAGQELILLTFYAVTKTVKNS